MCRHGYFRRLIVDKKPENKDLIKVFTRKYGIKRILISPYHSQANSMIERDHKPIINALSKMTAEGLGNQINNLPAVLWADRSTVKHSTEYIFFYLLYGREPILPIKLNIPIWRILSWEKIHNTTELIIIRARQIQRRDKNIKEARYHLQRQRIENKKRFNDIYRLHHETAISANNLILLFDSVRVINISSLKKFNFR